MLSYCRCSIWKTVCIDILHTIHTCRISQFPTYYLTTSGPPLHASLRLVSGRLQRFMPFAKTSWRLYSPRDIRHPGAHRARGFRNRLVRLVEVTKGQCEVTKVTTTFVKQDDVDPWRMELRGLEGSLEQRDLRQWWFLMVSIGFVLGTKLDVQMYRPTTREV